MSCRIVRARLTIGSILSTNDVGTVATDMNLNPHLIPYIKINPKWIKDLNIKAKTIKLPEEYKGIDLYDLVLGKEFFAFLEETKKKISKRKKYKQISFVKILKNISKDIIKNLKNKPTDREEIFVNNILIKVLYPKYIKNTSNLIIRQTTQF